MVDETARDAAERPLAPGTLLELRTDSLRVEVAPSAGGRIAQIHCDDMPWLTGSDFDSAAIAWGCYPMVPWVGRIRRGRFSFEGRDYELPLTLGDHAVHGVGFVRPWRVELQLPNRLELSLRLPRDASWPFGGTARQRLTVADRTLRLELAMTAEDQAMPRPVMGWHPWFNKPDAIEFRPAAMYPRDAEGIATLPLTAPSAGPWDDCFFNTEPVTLRRGNQVLRLTSACDRWVVFDERAHATCVEPQSGPPDAFNLDPLARLAPGQSIELAFQMEWAPREPAGS